MSSIATPAIQSCTRVAASVARREGHVKRWVLTGALARIVPATGLIGVSRDGGVARRIIVRALLGWDRNGVNEIRVEIAWLGH